MEAVDVRSSFRSSDVSVLNLDMPSSSIHWKCRVHIFAPSPDSTSHVPYYDILPTLFCEELGQEGCGY